MAAEWAKLVLGWIWPWKMMILTQKLAELTMENDDFTKILGIYDI